jgi:hypothetical protein
MREHTENTWPERIYVKQEGPFANVYDAADGSRLDDVLSISAEIKGSSTEVSVVRSRYTPPKQLYELIGQPVAGDWEEGGHANGILVSKRIYTVDGLSLTGTIEGKLK